MVGVGSVGTEAFMVLLMGDRDEDPLFLHVKEAGPSVLAPYAGASEYVYRGERVVQGQRLVQAASDAFLGWVTAVGLPPARGLRSPTAVVPPFNSLAHRIPTTHMRSRRSWTFERACTRRPNADRVRRLNPRLNHRQLIRPRSSASRPAGTEAVVRAGAWLT